MEEERGKIMEANNNKMSVSKPKSSSLFVPRASVIRHTKDFKLQNSNSYNSKLNLFDTNQRHVVDNIIGATERDGVKRGGKKEEKDSGIDESFDDEEEKYLMETGNSNSDSDYQKSGAESMDTRLPPPLKQMVENSVRSPNEYISQLFNRTFSDEQLARNFQNSVVHLLREPQLAYLLQLYHYADEGLLKDTLLKLMKNSYMNEGSMKKAKLFSNTGVEVSKKQSDNRPVDFAIHSYPEKEKFIPRTRSQSDSDAVGRSADTYYSPRDYEHNFSTLGASTIHSIPEAEAGKTYVPNTSIFKRSVSSDPSPPVYENNLQCEYCHKKFNNEDAAKRHLLTHKGKRTHKCTHCSRSFYEQSSYLRHLKSHSGEKAHKCDQCSMAFSKRSALEVHIRTHTGERPFVCKYCGKGFSISGNLHRHVLIHTGHRPYKCGKCPRAFNNPSHLARHISSFHA